MINASELRIGNLLYYNDGGECVNELCTIDATDIGIIANKLDYASMHLPIPLTEELILKLGFEVCHKTFVRHSFDYADSTEHGIEINLMERGGWAKPQYRYYGRYIDVQYVHQVQNLFYALSGIELKFKS